MHRPRVSQVATRERTSWSNQRKERRELNILRHITIKNIPSGTSSIDELTKRTWDAQKEDGRMRITYKLPVRGFHKKNFAEYHNKNSTPK